MPLDLAIEKVSKLPSKFGGVYYKIHFEQDYYTLPYPGNGNYKLWKPFCQNPEGAVGVICCGLVVKDGKLLNADFLERTRITHKFKQLDMFKDTK